MRLLITNDDGIDSVGLHALLTAALGHGHEVFISAPSAQCSAFSQHITLNTPLFITERSGFGVPAIAVEGSPTDCVRIAQEMFPAPDMVLSGINNGLNSGSATYYSGTCSAAREAAMLHLNSMAVSVDVGADDEMRAALAEKAIVLAERMAGKTLPRYTFINLNAPAIAPSQWLPMRMCPLSEAYFTDRYEMRVSPRGRKYFWLKQSEETGIEKEPETPGSDCDLLAKGYVTCTLVGEYSSHNAEFDFLTR